MKAVPFDYERDFAQVKGWLSYYNMAMPSEDMFPETGLIIPGVCSGHLFRTDSSICQLDFLFSNPHIDKEKRSEGLDVVVNNLIQIGKNSGFSLVFGNSKHPFVADRAKKLGFHVEDTFYYVFAKIIGEREKVWKETKAQPKPLALVVEKIPENLKH